MGTHFEMDGKTEVGGTNSNSNTRGPSLTTAKYTLLVNIHEWFSFMSAVATNQTPMFILSFVFQLMFGEVRGNFRTIRMADEVLK